MSVELKKIISKDIYRYYGKTKMPFLHRILPYNIGLKYIILFRKANYYGNHNMRKILFAIYAVKLKRLSIKTGFQINPKTQIGEGFYLGHMGATIINPLVKIGKNVSLAQGVTIGAHVRGEKCGCPIIGDEVYIGANAVIVGKIKIGNNVMIAPNSFVNINVPDNSIVLGNPARIIKSNSATEGFLVYKV